MSKKFNTTGKCLPDKHYMADVSAKLSEILKLIEDGEYFIINRPRQYGKTTTLYALGRALREQGYIALNMSFEGLDDAFFERDEAFATGFFELLGDYAAAYAPELEAWLVENR